MDYVDLPFLSADDSIENAIVQMNKYDRRFILAKSGSGQFRIYSNKEVLRAWRNKVKTLSHVKGGENVAIIAIPMAQVAAVEGYAQPLTVADVVKWESDDPQRQTAQRALNAAKSRFGILGTVISEMTGRSVEVLTLSGEIGNQARSKTKECICSKNSKHQGTSPPDNESECPYCDGGWRCA